MKKTSFALILLLFSGCLHMPGEDPVEKVLSEGTPRKTTVSTPLRPKTIEETQPGQPGFEQEPAVAENAGT